MRKNHKRSHVLYAIQNCANRDKNLDPISDNSLYKANETGQYGTAITNTHLNICKYKLYKMKIQAIQYGRTFVKNLK